MSLHTGDELCEEAGIDEYAHMLLLGGSPDPAYGMHADMPGDTGMTKTASKVVR